MIEPRYWVQHDLMGNQNMPEVKKDVVMNLKGELEERVTRVGDGSIICLFNKTPPPKHPTDVVCPHFIELKWANGCYYDCAWCYLQGTYRFHPEWKEGSPNIKDFDTIKVHLQAFLNDGSKPEILNTGELSDSLLTEHTKNPFSHLLSNIFSANHTKHKVLFLTKSTKIDNILNAHLQDYLIMSFTLNAEPVAKKWEKGTPSIEKRIEAAKKVYEAGYTTRIRIDPMVPIIYWKKHYEDLIDQIFDNEFRPERITIGSLRGLQTTITHAKDGSWVKYLSERSNWGRKIAFKTRFLMYSSLIEYLKNKYNYDRVALCKETKEMWEKLELEYKEIRCNCIG